MRAIDLYSGIGGWTLGLRMAGIETVASYEWWRPANETYENNFGRSLVETDIRKLPLASLPEGIDIVVGSPPCTQFSFANRGGNGDIADGLKDVAKFLEIVDHLQPRYWVMENVPRVASILERELGFGGKLHRFAGLVSVLTVVDMAEFGLPQRRRRMLAGSFPLDILLEYRHRPIAPTLGEVINALASKPTVDPVYGISIEPNQLRDHIEEDSLTPEEARLNQGMKQHHPFYNVMSFPDPLGRTARTVTALCTRVSRESIVVEGSNGQFRRLTLRERATLQGFPITFQLSGRSYTDRLRMIGNAIPPVLTFYIAQSLLGVTPDKVRIPRESTWQLGLPANPPPEIVPTPPKNRFAPDRRFRASIPRLRFGSGVRFELANDCSPGAPTWAISFYFGTSKNIMAIALDERMLDEAISVASAKSFQRIAERELDDLAQITDGTTCVSLQLAWTRQHDGLHPFELTDRLGQAAERLHDALPAGLFADIETFVIGEAERAAGGILARTQMTKLRRNAKWIFVGLILGSWLDSRSGLVSQDSLANAV